MRERVRERVRDRRKISNLHRAHIITAHGFAEKVLEKEEDRRGRSFSSVAAAGVITDVTTL